MQTHHEAGRALSSLYRGLITDQAWRSPAAAPQPDDLDLRQMARLALNYLRGNPDPARDYECKFSLGLLGIPYHVPSLPPNAYGYDPVSLGDTDSRMDIQYPHMRAMAREPEPDLVELGVRRRVLGYQHPDDHLCWINPAAYVGAPVEGTWIGPWTTAKLLYSLAETYARTGDPAARDESHRIFEALRSLAMWDHDRAYYWGIAPYKDGRWLLDGWCEYHGRNYPFIVEPLVRYWECTGDEEALALARAFTEGFLAGVQPDQRQQKVDPETGAFGGHVHLHTHAAWGVAHLGAVLGERRYLEWARRIHDYVLANGTDYGWYPEHTPQEAHRSEMCVVGDMVSLGAWLARGGHPEYWDHVERTLRNEIRRSQFTLKPSFLALFHQVHHDKPEEVLAGALAELRRLEGGFVAQALFDDWVAYPGTLGQAGINTNGVHMMGCCPPQGMNALWDAWNGTVEERPEGVFVNLCLTGDHPAARVVAYRPQDGGLQVEARRSGTFYLRVPAWAPHGSVRLSRDAAPAEVQWGGPDKAYVVCEGAAPGERLALAWAVPSFAQACVATSVPESAPRLQVSWLGNTVTGVEPRGAYLPMFGVQENTT